MTTGRINQVAFLSDVGSVRDKRPCGSSARRGHDSRTCRAKTLPIGRSEARRPHARSMLRIRDHKQKLVDLHNLTTSRGLIGTQALLRCPPAAREGQEEERDNERHHSLTIGCAHAARRMRARCAHGVRKECQDKFRIASLRGCCARAARRMCARCVLAVRMLRARHGKTSFGKICARMLCEGCAHAVRRQRACFAQAARARRMPRPRPRHANARQATPCQASNSLTFSKCLEWGNAKPRQGKACQGQAMPRPRHAKATPCQGTTCQGQGMTCQRKARPRHANASQGNACQGHAQRKARQSKGNASQGNACQGHAQRKASQGMPNARQAKANASQGNACQGHAQRKARQAKGNASQGNACQGQAKAMPSSAARASPTTRAFGGLGPLRGSANGRRAHASLLARIRLRGVRS
ncbi:unnamed protein product [Prunus brigantina]